MSGWREAVRTHHRESSVQAENFIRSVERNILLFDAAAPEMENIDYLAARDQISNLVPRLARLDETISDMSPQARRLLSFWVSGPTERSPSETENEFLRLERQVHKWLLALRVISRHKNEKGMFTGANNPKKLLGKNLVRSFIVNYKLAFGLDELPRLRNDRTFSAIFRQFIEEQNVSDSNPSITYKSSLRAPIL